MHFANKDNSSHILGGEIWLQRTLWPSLPWWIGRVTYADFDLSPWPFVCKGDAFRITVMWHVRKKRSGLWENKPPSFSPPRWWVYCFASQWLLLYCWALEVYVARNLTFVPRREEACDRGCFDYTQKSSGQKEYDFLSLCWRRLSFKKQEASWIGKTYFLLVSAFGKNIHSKDKTSQFIKWLLHLLKTVIFF